MKKFKVQAAVVCYSVISMLFFLLFIYMYFFENISIQKTRDTYSYYSVDDYHVEEIKDPSAPIGIRKEYRWKLDTTNENNKTLAFYLVHHYAEVYFGDELVYSLMPGETNKIGKSISSNWVIIPLYSEDNGKEVCVVVTPVYESVADREIEFCIGSLYSMYCAQLKKDFPQLLLSGLCIVAGIFIMLVQVVKWLQNKIHNWGIFYLGEFTMMFGIWKITDTRFSPFLFEGHTKVLGYISVGILFLMVIPFFLYLNQQFSEQKRTLLSAACMIASAAALAALVFQIFGIADFRQMLLLAHASIVMSLIIMVITVISQMILKDGTNNEWSFRLSMILVTGVIFDFIFFYVNKNSSGLVFSIFAVLIYTVLLFVIDIFQTNKKAYTDANTGLFNKAHWDVLMDSRSLLNEPIGLMMLDVNQLKHINDTMGHEAGDKIIFHFANILRNTIPPTNTICRWGGDEFTVLVLNANREIMEGYIRGINDAVTTYNESGEKPPLSYAVGYVLSTEFPGMSPKDLLSKADERMYQDKQKWYSCNLGE